MSTQQPKRRRPPAVWPAGTAVTWHYRSAIGHGTITGIRKAGTTHATTEYRIKEHDHHPGEPAVVFHYGRALTRARGTR